MVANRDPLSADSSLLGEWWKLVREGAVQVAPEVAAIKLTVAFKNSPRKSDRSMEHPYFHGERLKLMVIVAFRHG
jgi:hypothetical protein